jgi:hypothetical protein
LYAGHCESILIGQVRFLKGPIFYHKHKAVMDNYTFTDEQLKEKARMAVGVAFITAMILPLLKEEEDRMKAFDKLLNDVHQILIK